MTTVINLFGAPGAGKSTGAAYIFSKLKLDGISCEYVSEFAKDKCWENNKEVFARPENQFFIGANQFYRMSCLIDKVDVIVTDSPIIMNAFYNDTEALGAEYDIIMRRLSEMFRNMNFFVNRVKPYDQNGRNQTEIEAFVMAKEMRNWLVNKYGSLGFIDVCGDKAGYDKIYEIVYNNLKK
jgi:hypothetical protein